MKIFDANIPGLVVEFFTNELSKLHSLDEANEMLESISGIKKFFDTDYDFVEITEKIAIGIYKNPEHDRAEYGDFQTNNILATQITINLLEKGLNPEIIIEPTCGKGNFIIAALATFKDIKQIIGIEIYKPYVWETKFSILEYFLINNTFKKHKIELFHADVFNFEFKKIQNKIFGSNLLIIGNPPWVTNSDLSSLNSKNLPPKTNFKNQNGLDAMTGKGNFDIAEFITLSLLDSFHKTKGDIALLVKNSVIKNVMSYQKSKKFRISSIEKQCINSKKEFNVSVEAALFYCMLNSDSEFDFIELDFYTQKISHRLGWLGDKFVSNISSYLKAQSYDGLSPFEWRQGVKHDCSAFMELERVNGHFTNKLNEDIIIENDLVYGFLKSSDLKNTVIKETRKYTIITQTKIGQETQYIKNSFPKTYDYLQKHLSDFQSRKSIIYKDKPEFSIFGIGDYSFLPFKVAISGLYKTFHFTLVFPQNEKPVMLDDTCYFIGFEKIEYAVYAIILLNSPINQEFLRSITFPDAKRVFTKEVLMRMDMFNLANDCPMKYVNEQLELINSKFNLSLTLNQWYDFIEKMKNVKRNQIALFEK